MGSEYVKKISLILNGKEINNSLEDVGKEIGKLKRQFKKANNEEDREKINAQLKEARIAYKNIKDELIEQHVTLLDVRSAAENMFNGLLSGDFEAVENGFNTIKTGVKGATKAALAFVATPIGAAIATLATIGFVAKNWIDFNVAIGEANKRVKEITGASGILVDTIRIRSEVLNDTFKIGVEKSMETAKSLVENMGITYNQAYDLIEKGAIKGKHKNDEYLDSIAEYAPQFEQAGYSAKEFVAIVEAGIDLSVYKDKLPDAIKEAGTELRDGGKGLRDALTLSFGEPFSKDIVKRVQTGKTTVKGALNEIDTLSKKHHLSQGQLQQLTSKLFISAGEDAGGAIKIFEALNVAVENQKKPLDEIQKINKKNLDTQKELRGVYTSLFASNASGFQKMKAQATLWFNQFILKTLKGGVEFMNWFIDMKNEHKNFATAMSLVSKIISGVFQITLQPIKSIVKSIKGIGLAIEGIAQRDPSKIKAGLKQSFVEPFTDGFDIIKQKAKEFKDEFDAIQDGTAPKSKRITLEDYVTPNTDTKEPTATTPTVTNTVNENGLTSEDQAKLDSKKKLQDFLDEWNADKKLEEELKKFEEEQQEEEREILEKEAQFTKLEEEGVLLSELETAKQEQIQAIRDKWAEIRKQKNKEAFAKEALDRNKFHEDVINAEQTLQNAKQAALRFGLNSLRSFSKKGSDLYKGLFLLDKGFAASQVVIKGIEERAKIRAAYAAIPGGQAISTPLVLASKIRTGLGLASIGSTTIQAIGDKGFYDGGFTGDDPIFFDEKGRAVTGFTHKNEEVYPERMVNNPRFAATFQYLNSHRKNGNKNQSPLPEDTPTTSISETPLNNTNETTEMHLLAFEIKRLSNLLDGNLYSKLLLEHEDVEKINDLNDEINTSKTNGTLAE